jgi:DNA-binding response OmpR family regulator
LYHPDPTPTRLFGIRRQNVESSEVTMRHTVLVVDSDPRTRNLLRASLERRSFAVVEAPDPVSALTILLWTPVALVVVNPRGSRAGTPSPTAFDLLEWIRIDPSFSNIPVVMFVGAPPSEEEARAVRASRVEVVRKLDGVASLAARIRALLHDDRPDAVPSTRPAPEWLQLHRVFRVHGPVRGWNALHRLRARS